MSRPSHHHHGSPGVTVIGVGTMGGAMAGRLLASGVKVGVWSRGPETIRPLVELGATGHADVAEASAAGDVVLTMLPTADVTAHMMFDDKGLDAMAPNAIWVQMATIGVTATELFQDETRARRPDVTFVDAPVSGSREPATTGQLLILASGPDSAARPLEPIFGALGRRTLWLGPAGAGSAMKLVLNTWLAFQMEGAAESASLARRLGVDSASLVEALRDNPLSSGYALAKLDRILKEDYHADFALDWALKDLDLVATDAGGSAAPIAVAIADRWRTLVDNGSSGLDISAAGRGLTPAS